ncbi:MAG: hypothetical protein M0R30_02715 [Methanoregula sp.]|jgi:hypothetical protein|uniref:hypothetical protein n=1 Tax=Methanoregula sp. TaxID=2052170 RepID=UPI0025F6C1D7|nr:hypothetical protein [Methanoregula sp.]MCK9630531.1 hypothetical protein [Methanoregula sp.]
MIKNEKNNKGSAPGIRILGMLVIVCLCCIALFPAVAALPNKWLTDNRTVLANNSYYGTIDDVDFTNDYFFAIIGNSHFNTTAPAWNWTGDANPNYYNRYYLRQLKIGNTWYPPSLKSGDYQWVIVDKLDIDRNVYKWGLATYVEPPNGTYYLWFGNRTAAYIYHPPYKHWLCPTYENATYVVALPVEWVYEE